MKTGLVQIEFLIWLASELFDIDYGSGGGLVCLKLHVIFQHFWCSLSKSTLLFLFSPFLDEVKTVGFYGNPLQARPYYMVMLYRNSTRGSPYKSCHMYSNLYVSSVSESRKAQAYIKCVNVSLNSRN